MLSMECTPSLKEKKGYYYFLLYIACMESLVKLDLSNNNFESKTISIFNLFIILFAVNCQHCLRFNIDRIEKLSIFSPYQK